MPKLKQQKYEPLNIVGDMSDFLLDEIIRSKEKVHRASIAHLQ